MSTLAQLPGEVRQLHLYQYFSGVALTIYLYDYSLTFAREVELIWTSKWTVMKFVFLIDRYLIIVNFILQALLLGTRPVDCQALANAFANVALIGVFLSEVILCLRLWVMWQNDKRVLAGLITMFIGGTVVQGYFGGRYLRNGVYRFETLPYGIEGCVFDGQFSTWYNTFFVNLILNIEFYSSGACDGVDSNHSNL
ncbi:hypothetical protein P691DRAFT_764780 [Macrolepiota fuliginosa MF-IS2]|uniref:DUF6533 domain-containing protein n=1 Tax=Macrolepiota fuliginosa MF-IS2 TaxID=1400762 RepID=A0A9P6BYQ7_9AGAR|nr:hypothetical protein P691DRAFT_764780 [Macrolepiota fuliginosa MF-IS2]